MKELSKALLKFQEKCPVVGKDATNPFFKSKYAPLDMIWKAIKEPLQECGLIIVQPVVGQVVKTTVIHAESGEQLESEFPIVAKDHTPQALGSAVTYARRYSLCSLLSIQTGEDDDGNTSTTGANDLIAKQKRLIQLYGDNIEKAKGAKEILGITNNVSTMTEKELDSMIELAEKG